MVGAIRLLGNVLPPVVGEIRPLENVLPPVVGGIRPLGNVLPPVVGEIRPLGNVLPPVVGGIRPLGNVLPPVIEGIRPLGNVLPPVVGINRRTPIIIKQSAETSGVPADCYNMLCHVLLLHQLTCAIESCINMRTNVILSNEAIETSALKSLLNCRSYTRKHNIRTFALRHITEVLKVVNTR